MKREELMEVEGGWIFRALRVVAVAAAAIHDLIHDDVCGGSSGRGSVDSIPPHSMNMA